MLRLALIAFLAFAAAPAAASQCYSLAERAGARYAAFDLPAQYEAPEVRITFVAHSTFRIESPAGVTVATDFAGLWGPGRVPDIVTMNHAHETHFTNFPDPRIAHVLRGWNPDGDGPARHELRLGDLLVRNVPTNIRRYDGGTELGGNSIFVFEVADLCIGHLGHLHHPLTPAHLALIGRLDIVMAPVDGSYTLRVGQMVEVLKALRARLVLPMHAFGDFTLRQFIAGIQDDFAVVMAESREITVSVASLPRTPTVLVVPLR